ncbi:hypothetical protein DZF91_09405 [Actinomadura logoneensis]|uniref:Uncharacterized protein n=1 Tax=Actinomadura logoneensis TaxID=2293572 RepID=A0A372JPA8_9ACTN|nr:hypothetical protein [Actinomadura logoneensis]RFU41861.1 hypothetical protein DZF91_09405 [Actinomadura logoneensis]
MRDEDAGAEAASRVEAVRDGPPAGRLRLAAAFYRGRHARYGRAELSFLRWTILRGVLDPPDGDPPGSPWWRAVNERLLLDKTEAALLDGSPASDPRVALWQRFLRDPSPASWYRAHNASVVAGYLENLHLAVAELPAERFMMNVALMRVLYTHAMVAHPRLALGPLAPLGPFLGDPRKGTVGFFLDLRRAFPERYPLTGLSAESLIGAQGGLPRLLDHGVIKDRTAALYRFTARSLDEPRVADLHHDGLPDYAWPAEWLPVRPPGTVHPRTRILRLAARATRPEPPQGR